MEDVTTAIQPAVPTHPKEAAMNAYVRVADEIPLSSILAEQREAFLHEARRRSPGAALIS